MPRVTVYTDTFTQKSVHRIFQDSTGFLWFGTQDGAVRFDGVLWKRVSTADGLGANHVAGIGQDDTGRLWFGTVGGGLAVHDAATQGDTGGFVRFLAGEEVRDLLCIGDTVWAATGKGIAWVRGGETRWLDSGLPSRDVLCLFRARDGRVWAGTRAGVAIIDNERVADTRRDLALATFATSCVFEDGAGDVWCGTLGGGLVRIPSDAPARGYSSVDGLCGDHVMCGMRGGQPDELWVGAWGAGVSQVKLRSLGGRCVFTTVSSKDGVGNDNIRSLCLDNQGQVWIGTGGRGATCYVPSGGTRAFVSYNKSDGLGHDMVACITQDSKGTYWFGSFGGGVSSFSPASVGRLWQTYTTKDGLAHDTVRAVYADARDRIWFGTAGGGITRHRPDLREWKRFSTADGLAGNVVRCFQNVGDELWIGTDGGISCLQPELMQLSRNYTQLKGTVLTIVPREREVWAGGLGTGVMRFANGQWQALEGLPTDQVTCLLPVRDFWLMGTYGGGLLRYKDGAVTTLRQRDGLPHDIIYGLVADTRGNIFGTSVRGVFELLFHDDTPTIRTYDHTDGLADDECNGGAVYCDRGGRLWFGTIGGVSELTPAALPASPEDARALISDVRADRKPVNIKDGVVLEGFETLFEYTVVDFIAPTKLVFQCRLAPIEKDWLPITNERSLRYTNLPPGEYAFMVRARGLSGLFGPTATLDFTRR